MENPFEVLGIGSITREQQVAELTKRLDEMLELQNTAQEFTPNRGVLSRNRYSLIRGSNQIEDCLNEQFILGLSPVKKFFSKEDWEKKLTEKMTNLEIKKMTNSQSKKKDEEVLRGFKRVETDVDIEAKRLSQSLLEQLVRLRNEVKVYSQVLENFRANPDNQEYIDALNDLYIKNKFESEIMKVASRVAENLEVPKRIENNDTFYEALTSDSQYQKLASAYSKVATVKAREDLIPEIYVKSRMFDTSGITVLSEEYIRTLVRREKKYRAEFSSTRDMTTAERYQRGFAENQEHDYGWGIVLRDSTFLFKDEPVDNAIFQGKITVENIGNFTEESMFNARRYVRERKVNTAINHSRRSNNAARYTMDNSKSSFRTIREYAWFYEATKTLYDYIYKVTKTDKEGRTTTDIVFSPLIARDLDSKESVDFIKNVYFSDYMLRVARENGGYAGRIIKSPEGFSISNKYSDDEIAVAVLFDRGLQGNILDCRGNNRVPFYNVNKQNFLSLVNRTERTRETHE